MDVCSIPWLLGLVLASAVFFFLPEVRPRQVALALCSLGFLATQVPNVSGWIALVVFLAAGYLAVRIIRRFPSRVVLFWYLLVLVGAFVYIKQYAFLQFLLPAAVLHHTVMVVGFSYMLFRQIHLVVDGMQGQIEGFSLWNYLNYQLNLFGLIAGPIQRYQEFNECWTQLTPILTDWQAILKAYLRIFIGVIKIMALAPPCLAAYKTAFDNFASIASAGAGARQFLLLLYLFLAYLYFNFSGYCDMVIGGGSLLGLRMPENFNYPFLSRNLSDLWTRWHRTLGFWIRDYMFTPLFKTSVERWPRLANPLSMASYLIAFSLAGIWHGSSGNFLIFGLLNGVGVCAAKLWELFLLKRSGRKGLKAYLQSDWIRMAATICTIHYFGLTLIFFSSDLKQALSIFRHLGALL